MSKYLTMYGVSAELDISVTGTPTFAELGDGIENLTEALNEVVFSGFFLKDKGFGRSEVTGMQPIFSFSGKRMVGDPVQDYVFDTDRKYGLGDARKTTLRLTLINGTKSTKITAPVTIAAIQELSGASQEGSAISFELRFNGKPEIEKE